jgi:hypothetical protein
MIRARVFSKNGNRFLIPGYWCDEDDDNWPGMSITSILCDGMMLGVVCGLDSHQEWLDVEAQPDGTADLVHVPYDMVGAQFAHGGTRILLISGPLFDAALAAVPEQSRP